MAADHYSLPPYRAELPVDGRAVDRVVLTRCAIRCAGCEDWIPIADVGLRYVTASREVRSQPRCVPCRGRVKEQGDQQGELF